MQKNTFLKTFNETVHNPFCEKHFFCSEVAFKIFQEDLWKRIKLYKAQGIELGFLEFIDIQNNNSNICQEIIRREEKRVLSRVEVNDLLFFLVFIFLKWQVNRTKKNQVYSHNLKRFLSKLRWKWNERLCLCTISKF